MILASRELVYLAVYRRRTRRFDRLMLFLSKLAHAWFEEQMLRICYLDLLIVGMLWIQI
jgi:hypothetical protein